MILAQLLAREWFVIEMQLPGEGHTPRRKRNITEWGYRRYVGWYLKIPLFCGFRLISSTSDNQENVRFHQNPFQILV